MSAVAEFLEITRGSAPLVLSLPHTGGWITRHYGCPDQGIHAVQMELACRSYMREPIGPVTEANWPAPYDAGVAGPLRGVLRSVLETCKVSAAACDRQS